MAAALLSLSLAAVFAAVPNPPPTQRKSIHYSLRDHANARMLYDWNTRDPASGMYVRDIVDRDMDALSRAGYNVLHLYLWDRKLVADSILLRQCGNPPAPDCSVLYSDPSGFAGYPSNPALFSPQFMALQEFVAKAEGHGLFVALHFASGQLIHEVQNSDRSCSDIAADFSDWAGAFISGLTPTRHNVLAWGVAYAFAADPLEWAPEKRSNDCFGRVYQAVDTLARRYAPPGLTGLGSIAVNPFGERHWDVARAQQTAHNMTRQLSFLYGQPKSPDLYILPFASEDASELAATLWTVSHSNGGDASRMTIPEDLVMPVEFATSPMDTADGGVPPVPLSGGVAGIVTATDTSKPLARAAVVLVGRPNSGPPVFFRTVTGEDGSYMISNMPAGTYSVCASYRPPLTGGSRDDFWASRAYIETEVTYIDSCDWSQSSVIATVAGGPVSNVNVTLQRGVKVSVVIYDLSASEEKTRPSFEIAVLDTSGAVRAALPMVNENYGVRTYEATLPRYSAFIIEVRASGATLMPFGGGAAYPPVFRVPIQTTNHSLRVATLQVQR